jgi:hypothetical protein
LLVGGRAAGGGGGTFSAFSTQHPDVQKKRRNLTEATLFSIFCASVLFVHQTNKMPEPEKKYVDGAAYYGDTTYLWRNMKILSIIIGCKFLYRHHFKKAAGRFSPGSLSLSLFFCVYLSLVRSFVRKKFIYARIASSLASVLTEFSQIHAASRANECKLDLSFSS